MVNEPDSPEPKTATDVEIENLKNMMADMQKKYDETIAKMEEANRSLYAHAVGTDAEAEVVPDEPQFDIDKAVRSCLATLGFNVKDGE